MSQRRSVALFLVALFSITGRVFGQQPDLEYRYNNRSPAYQSEAGPTVCIDEAHSNRHTLGGTYAPFATLLRADGYRVQALTAWSKEALCGCGVLVIANALPKAGVEARAFPHASAFGKGDIETLITWLTDGGSVLLIADHAPYPGAMKDIGLILGVDMLDAFAAASAKAGVITVFGTPEVSESIWQQYAEDRKLPPTLVPEVLGNPGAIGTHPILRGRTEQERVPWVITFTGHAFYPSTRVEPLLVFGPRAAAMLDRADASPFQIGGWLQAGALHFGKGRAVVLGEATACTAQVGGPSRIPTGMNTAIAPCNARFCLNIMHWLTGLLDDR